MNNVYAKLQLLIITLSLLITLPGCNFLQPSTPAAALSPGIPAQQADLPLPATQAATPQAIVTTPAAPSDIPSLVSIGNRAPFGTTELGLITVQNEYLGLEPSPVEFELFWDYSPQTGRLAYSSEFYHAPADGGNVSVSDLWVYDYTTGAAQMWLADNVARALWTPGGGSLTVAIYNPAEKRIDLAFISGSNQVQIIAECASYLYSWSPDGDQLAYVNSKAWAGVLPECAGTYLVSFPKGLSTPETSIQRVSDFGLGATLNHYDSDQPFWALEQNALIYPDTPFWVIPLDGSPAFVPQAFDQTSPLELPRPYAGLWDPDTRRLIGSVESGQSSLGGVWVYDLSPDLHTITGYYRIGNIPLGYNSFIDLVSWWVPGESILVADTNQPYNEEILSENWGVPRVWSLTEKTWLPISFK